MSVYIDDAFIPATVGRLTSRWSHMFADSTEELVAFAMSLGLRASWIQYPGTPKEHFDVTEPKRRLAVAKGAVEITYREAALRRKRLEEELRAAAE
ncbi:hypothetical protein GCM10023063_15730 [Arthrobacter methylotrophus]|uniref:DUF4031 domain-containing protein n=1 Tax=Arthrobacter methylotrophus TaxID=121291 RepID=A0ABV5UPD4_9MICC